MKRYVLCLLMTHLVLISCRQDNRKSSSISNKTDSTAAVYSDLSVDELEQKALQKYQESPKSSIDIFKELALRFKAGNNVPKAAITNLNVANIYDEHFLDFTSAHHYASLSLDNWKAVKDDMQIANLKKYLGYLNGKLGNYETGKEEIMEAIRLYNKMAYDQGVAVSNFNLARVYYEEKNYEGAIKPFKDGLKYWTENENAGRIFTMNTFGMQLYRAVGDDEIALKLQQENNIMRTKVRLPESEVVKFEELIKY